MRRALLLLGALLLAATAPAAAQHDSSIVIRSFDTELRVSQDGTLDVTESLHLAFHGRWNGIFRDLSLQHNTGQGRRARLDVDVIAVTDDAGRSLQYWEESPESGVLRGPTLEGFDGYGAYRRSKFSGWTVSAFMPADHVDAPIATTLSVRISDFTKITDVANPTAETSAIIPTSRVSHLQCSPGANLL